MKKNVKMFSAVLMIALALFAFTSCGSQETQSSSAGTASSSTTTATPSATASTPGATGTVSSDDVVKIGVLTDRSSGGAATVAWAEAGAELAAKEINEAGGINGKMIQLVYRDTGNDPSNVAQRSTELVAEGVVAILGPKGDGEAPTAAQWAETNKFPMVTPCTMNTRVTVENASRYMFSCGFNAWAIGNMNALYAQEKGYKTAYFVGLDGGASADSRDFFVRAMGDDFNLLGSSQVSSSSTEFSNIISSIVGRDPDVIISSTSGPNFVSFINQGRMFGLWNIADYLGWYTVDSTNNSALAEAGTYPYGKVHGVALWPFWMSEIEGNDEMVESYIEIGAEMYNMETLPSDMGYTWYIGIKAIAAALESTDDWSPEGVTDALETVRFDTIYGKNLGFRDFDHVMNHTYYYVTAVEDETGEWNIPIGEILNVYEAEDVLPTKEELAAYAEEQGFTFTDLSQF